MSELVVSAAEPAVVYVRVSSREQAPALQEQQARLVGFAKANGYRVVAVYADCGKSGLTLTGRSGLHQLLRDVADPSRAFSTVLLQDVSRWGRFQDADQHAAYEYLCRNLGVSIRYVEESFPHDHAATPLLKTVKRIMAAEFSRDLSVRTSRAQWAAAHLGFKMGGPAPFGFVRLMVNETGDPVRRLAFGEHRTHGRVVLRPDGAWAVDRLRRIVEWFNAGVPLSQIVKRVNDTLDAGADRVNARRLSYLLRSELLIGVHVFGRVSFKLKGHRVLNPEELWVRTKVSRPIVRHEAFQRLAERLAAGPYLTPEDIRQRLKWLYAERGDINLRLIRACAYLPDPATVRKYFGGIENIRRVAGCPPRAGRPLGQGAEAFSSEGGLEALRRLYAEHGFVSQRLVNAATDMPCAKWYYDRFGGLLKAYAAAGFEWTQFSQQSAGRRRQIASERGASTRGCAQGRPDE